MIIHLKLKYLQTHDERTKIMFSPWSIIISQFTVILKLKHKYGTAAEHKFDILIL